MKSSSRKFSSFPLRTFRRTAVASVIVIAHVAITALLLRDSKIRLEQEEEVEPMVMRIIEAEPASMMALNMELPPVERTVDIPMPLIPAEAQQLEPEMQPPRIDSEARMDMSGYNAQAMLSHGERAIVMLMLEIGEDGFVISAEVVRTEASERATAAALDYALATRWSPGKLDGEPSAMKASLTVILGEQS